MAFTAKILSWRFRHLNIVGCLLKRRPTKGGHGHPRTPPSYAPANVFSSVKNLTKGSKGVQRYIFRKSVRQSVGD